LPLFRRNTWLGSEFQS